MVAAGSSRRRSSSARSRGRHGGAAHARDALDLGGVRDGHDAGDDRDRDASLAGALDEVEVVAVVEKELGDDEVDARPYLGQKVLHVAVEVAALRVALGIAGPGQAQPFSVALPDEGHQVGGVQEAPGRLDEVRCVGRRISAQGDHVLDATVDKLIDKGRELLARRGHGGQVGHGAHAFFALNARDQIDGAFARRAARAVGDGHEVRGKVLQIVDGTREVGRPRLGLGRKELEREKSFARGEEVGNLHGREVLARASADAKL
jgi:hypothetical protein